MFFFLISRWYFRNFQSAAAPFSHRETTGKNVYFLSESILFCFNIRGLILERIPKVLKSYRKHRIIQ